MELLVCKIILTLRTSRGAYTVTVHCPRCHSDEVYRHGR
ncbi:hypothetical protein GQW12_20820, partial [Shigella dysenteriae]|nr:hypothetical protein [Shigella dysenteriae]